MPTWFVIVVAAYAADDAKPNSQMIVTPIEDARFVPVDPQRQQGAQMAVLWGDPNTGTVSDASTHEQSERVQ